MVTLDNIEPARLSYTDFKNYIKEALKENQGQTLEELSQKTIIEQGIAPWASAFKDSWQELGEDPGIINTLIQLCDNEDSNIALGAIYLLSRIDKLYENKDSMLQILYNLNQPKYSNLRSAIFYNILQKYLSESLFSEAKILIENLSDDENLSTTIAELKSFLEIPFYEIIKEMAEEKEQYYEQFKHFLREDIRISRIVSVFFEVYKNSNSLQKRNLLKYVDKLIIEEYKDKRTANFISQLLGNNIMYREYKESIEPVFASERLRPIAFRSDDSAVKRSIQRSIFNYQPSKEELYSLVARGSIKNLDDETKKIVFDVFNKYKANLFGEPFLIPEDFRKDLNIEERAILVREQTNESEVPIKIDEIIKKFSLPLERIYSNKDFDGCLLRTEGLALPIIVINENRWPDARKRFTLAHELSHYILPEHFEYSGFCFSEWGNGDKKLKAIEREADELAAAILMPHKNILNDIKHGITPWSRIKNLIEKYEVSKIAFIIRALKLKSDPPVVFFRFKDGKCDFRRFSEKFPLDSSLFLGQKNKFPSGSGVERIISGEVEEVEEATNLENWLKSFIDGEHCKYKAEEYSTKYGETMVLTLLVLYSDYNGYNDDDLEEKEHNKYLKSQKKFGYRTIYG